MLLLGRETTNRKFWRRDTHLARGVSESCLDTYRMTLTGLCPEVVKYGEPPGYFPFYGSIGYYLRPEALEAMFYLKRFTKEPKWEEHAWEMFSAMERHLKVENGYSGIRNITRNATANETMVYTNKMESFFLAETLKYALLVFEDPDSSTKLMDLDEWVFNTEAHPLRIIDPRKDPLIVGAYDLKHRRTAIDDAEAAAKAEERPRYLLREDLEWR